MEKVTVSCVCDVCGKPITDYDGAIEFKPDVICAAPIAAPN